MAGSAEKILVVDDERDFAELIRQNFRRQIEEDRYQFLFAFNGKDALETVEAHPDLEFVLTDINMPGIDGLTLLTKLREIPDRMIRSVVITAFGDIRNIRAAMNRGAYDFLTKPINLTDLEITIEKTLEELQQSKRSRESRLRLQSVEQELNFANEIQQAILPKSFPLPPETSGIEIHAEMLPARKVGGDFYDYFSIGHDRIGFVIGDVSGKGIPAALFMAVSRATLKAIALRGVSPAECLTEVNRLLCEDSNGQIFVTLFYGILDVRTGLLHYTNGGHNPPFLLSANGEVRQFDNAKNPLLGMIEEARYTEQDLLLSRGDTLFLYTDGVTEAVNDNDHQFSIERLAALLSRCAGMEYHALAKTVLGQIRSHMAHVPPADDLTTMILRYRGLHRD